MITETTLKNYLLKSGDNYQALYPGRIIESDLDDGFISADVLGDVFFVYQCYGDGRKWDKRIVELAKKYNCKHIQFLTKRNPQAFEKKFGYKINGYLMTKPVEENT